MRWEDEQYIKVYTRDTGEWLALGWEAQSLFLLLLRKSDRAGIVHSGRAAERGLAGMTGMPLDVVSRALRLLLDDGCLRECDGGYVVPNFIAAQEARQTDKTRKAAQRQRDRDQSVRGGSAMVRDMEAAEERARSHEVTPVVTRGHTRSHGVTLRREETRIEEKREDLFPESAGAAPVPVKSARKAKDAKKPDTDPRHAPLVKALVALGFPFDGGRDAKN